MLLSPFTRVLPAASNLFAQVASEGDTAGDVAQTSRTLMQRLTPLNQIRVITGLFTVIVLGLVIFLVIKAGAHMWRGLAAAANRLPAESAPQRDDWADKPLNESLDADHDPPKEADA